MYSREVDKTYIALVSGTPSVSSIDAPLMPHSDPSLKPRHMVHPDGKPALTNLEVIDSFPAFETLVGTEQEKGVIHYSLYSKGPVEIMNAKVSKVRTIQ